LENDRVAINYSGYSLLRLSEKYLHNYNRSIADRFVKHISVGYDVLDFGAGIGTLSSLVREKAVAPLCLEIDPGQAEILRRRGFTVVTSLDDIADSSLDVIYSSNVLEHIEDDASTLACLYQKLRTGGKLCLYVPAFDCLYSSMDKTVGHFRRYTKATLREKLKAAGFKTLTSSYADSLGFVTTVIFKLLKFKDGVNPTTLVIFDRYIFLFTQAIERVFDLPFGKNVYTISEK